MQIGLAVKIVIDAHPGTKCAVARYGDGFIWKIMLPNGRIIARSIKSEEKAWFKAAQTMGEGSLTKLEMTLLEEAEGHSSFEELRSHLLATLATGMLKISKGCQTEAAHRLGVHRNTIHRLIYTGMKKRVQATRESRKEAIA